MNKKLHVLFEDNHLIVVNKPAGLLIHGDDTGDKTLLDEVKAYIKRKYKKPGDVFLGVIHRIDRPVSGVVVLARTSKALSRMNKLFQNREIDKRYHAIVWQRPPELTGRLEHFISKDNVKNVAKIHTKQKDGSKLAILDYTFLSEISHYILLEINLLTGRPHQIRAQLKAIGSPIVGDRKYGFFKFNVDKSICLHCRSMSFIHPVTKKRVKFSTKYPKNDIWDLFR